MAAKKGNNYSLKRKTRPQYTQSQIDKIKKELLDWASDGEGVYIATFLYQRYGKSREWLHDLADHHPDMIPVMEQAKQLNAGKVANKSFFGGANAVFGEKILPMYCAEYKALLAWKASLDKPSEESHLSLTMLRELKASGMLDKLLSQPVDMPKGKS